MANARGCRMSAQVQRQRNQTAAEQNSQNASVALGEMENGFHCSFELKECNVMYYIHAASSRLRRVNYRQHVVRCGDGGDGADGATGTRQQHGCERPDCNQMLIDFSVAACIDRLKVLSDNQFKLECATHNCSLHFKAKSEKTQTRLNLKFPRLFGLVS